VDILFSLTLFTFFGAAFVFVNLLAGSLARPKLPHPQKADPYECGEPSSGTSWVQFDLRFYIIALIFLIFDVEVALFYPWAIAYGNAAELAHQFSMTIFSLRLAALVDMLVFFTILMIGFAYLWRFGYLDWVRSTTTVMEAKDKPLVMAESELQAPVTEMMPQIA
jgi:NADH-quinone oxidoreductase subunit A